MKEKTSKGYIEVPAATDASVDRMSAAVRAVLVQPDITAAAAAPERGAATSVAPANVDASHARSDRSLDAMPAPEELSAQPTTHTATACSNTAETASEASSAGFDSLDAQSDRAFEGICVSIADGVMAPNERVLPARLKQQFGITDQAASMALERLRASALVSGWGSSASVRLDAQGMAKALVAHGVGAPVPPPSCSAVPAGAAPWLSQGEPVRLSPDLQMLTFASRRHPKPLPAADASASWEQIHKGIDLRVDLEATDAGLRRAVHRMIMRAQSTSPPASADAEADALLLALVFRTSGDFGAEAASAVVQYLVASAGLAAAVDVYLAAQQIQVQIEWGQPGATRRLYFTATVSETLSRGGDGALCSGEAALRAHLAAAPEAVWAACAARIEDVLPCVHPIRQPILALLLPDRPELSNAVALRLAELDALLFSAHYLLLTCTDSAAQVAAIKAQRGTASFWGSKRMTLTLVMERGAAAADVLALHADQTEAGNALTCIGTPKAVSALAKVASTSDAAQARLRLALDRWPLAAVVALASLVAQDSKDSSLLVPHLLRLLRVHGGAVDALRPWMDSAARAVVDQRLTLLTDSLALAGAEELPAVLVAPPWLAKVQKKATAPLELEPLALAPVEHWCAGARESALQLGRWQRDQFDKARTEVGELLNMMGLELNRWFSSTERDFKRRWDTSMKASREAAAEAIRSGDADALVTSWQHMLDLRKQGGSTWFDFNGLAAVLLPPTLGLALWNAATAEVETRHADFVMASLGLPALPGLLAVVRSKPIDNSALALNYGAVELALPLARAFAKLKTQRDLGRQWLLKFPEHAACGMIAPALGKKGEARECAGAALRLLQAQGHASLLLDVASRYADPKVAHNLRAVLEESPLDRFPAKRSALPEWWQPRGWRRPALLNGEALTIEAVDHLGQMLSFPAHEEVYAGIAVVKEACQSASLADFGWDIFVAWLDSGGSGKESWVLAALGQLGNDDTARRLTPFIRAWPGESLHVRAVSGLDTLAAIGTDVALMLLNGIAQKIKFKGLQDKAREKIDAIAEARGLSTEELEDRLAPDLGLDERGSLVLDFGPRAFSLAFDEGLKPYVREVCAGGALGARLSDLPKPRKTDDAAMAKESVERFKLLKKDARTVASQQLLRLEVAMCTRRRWTPELFRLFLVEHPLLRHLVQRLVWAVYEVADGASNGGRLRDCFRVAEDGSLANAEDGAFELPDGDTLRIGVPHVLEIPASDAVAFGQVFVDYELLQPFAQLGRDTYALTEEEKRAVKLMRWNGIKVPTGKVLGLVNKGWRRGQAQDGGSIWHFSKPLGTHNSIELHLDPGIVVGMVDGFPEQTLRDVLVGKTSSRGDIVAVDTFGSLDEIAASELVRDLEALRD